MMFDLNGRDKPVLKWAGGKSSLLSQLIPLFPDRFDRYVEPFLGGAALFLSLRNTAPALINELNPELFNLYSVVRANAHELSEALANYASRYSKDFYYELRAANPHCPIERAARTIFLNKTGYNGLYRQNLRGQFNVPFGHRKNCPQLADLVNLKNVSRRLAHADLWNCDFADVLAETGRGDFVYCDPPYEPISTTSSFNSYNGGGFTRRDQQRLAESCEAAARRGATVAVSNSTSPFIIQLYSGWSVHKIRARRAINSNALRRGEIEEVLAFASSLPSPEKPDHFRVQK